MKLSFTLLLILGAALAACSRVGILNGVFVPTSGYAIHKDIAYGADPRQILDVYVPDTMSPAQDVIVFFYGGRWKEGNKADYRFVGQAFASKGYITVIADYRLYPQVKFPAFLEDAARAVAWAHAHIAEYGGNPERLFVAGHSAGAYIAVMLATNGHYLKAAHAKPGWVKGAIGLAGPYDFLPFTDDDVKDIFSTAPDALTQPIHYVKPGLVPMLLLTGDEDTNVKPKNTHNMAQKLREFHVPVTEITYPGVAHIGIVLALANGFRGKAPVLADIDRFIYAQ